MQLAPVDDYQYLFLDRDGVINDRLPGHYVRKWSEFNFSQDVPDSIARLSNHFRRIVVVTNQQGIGKGLMTEEEAYQLHQHMLEQIQEKGGRIDGVYCCPDLSTDQPNCRKPNPELAYRAQRDFPDIDFGASVMVGDSMSDLQFGRHLGMLTVHITTKSDEPLSENDKKLWVDYSFDSLSHFAEWWLNGK